jgi:tripartite ATP-independent transporter DctM subunit
MSGFGLALLALVGITLIGTGLPAYAALILASVVGAVTAVASGHVPMSHLSGLPGRIVNLLENDLLQALPLYVLMGVLLNRMAVTTALFRTATWLLPRAPAAPLVAGLGLGALLGPMSGSVGASALALSRTMEPRLAAAGIAAPTRQATIALASTLGVVVPPSLVLILLGDAMLTAHTIASNTMHRTDRIINTQDVMRGALLPAGILLVLCLLVAWVMGNRGGGGRRHVTLTDRPSAGELALSALTVAFLLLVLGGVALGYFYAVEAAATGAFMLFCAGVVSGRISPTTLRPMLAETMSTTGALFAPLVAATTFTLLLRLLGTDKLIEAWVTALPGGNVLPTAAVLGAIFACAFVLDAFEIIFVAVPVLMPALLMRVPDAVWASSLLLLTLQASFLLPPIGYALMITRGLSTESASAGSVARALAPFAVAQIMVLALVLAVPALVHVLEPDNARSIGTSDKLPDGDTLEKQLRQIPQLPIGKSFN